MAKRILHDAHAMHPLEHCFGRYRCDGCGCMGAGPRYRCDACDFDLHVLCASPPSTTAQFFFHGQHPLTFEAGVDRPRCCDICETPIRGMRYACRPCSFDVHPVCSQLSASTVSPLHPEHVVTLTVGAPAKCAWCGSNCAFRYCCGACDFNLHPKCLLTGQAPLNIPKIY
ncbi:hypothetical protein QOZ80_3AG0238200 [Eleusine coracana subsp. coracana]|nr:hypothetical protein QOZ80_3AG0238200 [Eleusine coracana subsp. coracana]